MHLRHLHSVKLLQRLLSALVVIVATAGYDSAHAEEVLPGSQPAAVAQAIRFFFESRLEELKPAYRGHWVLRLYRVTGDERYLHEIQAYGARLQIVFKTYAAGIEDPVFRRQAASDGLGPVPKPDHEKHLRRREVLAGVPEYLVMHRLLYLAFQLKSLGLDKTEGPVFEKTRETLRLFPFRKYLLDPQLIRYHASEISNDVYYLEGLGLDGAAEDFRAAFEAAHQNTDSSGDAVLFENKIYGLTHLIIAASGYYQHTVPAEKFRWILDYFEKNLDMILARTKSDVIGEVGLCFRLAGLPDHPVVGRTRGFIVRAWDPAFGMLPSQKGRADLNKGEHRNVIAYLLITGFERLYPGPDLSNKR